MFFKPFFVLLAALTGICFLPRTGHAAEDESRSKEVQVAFNASCNVSPNDSWLAFEGNPACKKNKKIVLISGDEEYRSEEELTQLAGILSLRHGFDTVVLFAIDPRTGYVDPTRHDNIPGLSNLRDADLVILSIKVKTLPDDQLVFFLDYLRRGGPILALRTATHAFRYPEESPYNWLSFRYEGERADWHGGFGRKILGETWVAHHAHQRVNATRAVITPQGQRHPVLQGVGDIVVPTDLYSVRLPMSDDCTVLCQGLALETMSPDSPPLPGPVNDPKMPLVWTKPYSFDDGPEGRTLTTTMGSAEDLLQPGFRRLLVNAAYWLTGMTAPENLVADTVGQYRPSRYAFGGHKKDMRPISLIDTTTD
ncbi:MAG: ThuA domain-containing protein [Planctomycetia bacterium]|nr:ThuA domain-containing protein [Planctomycetia bacterium]